MLRSRKALSAGCRSPRAHARPKYSFGIKPRLHFLVVLTKSNQRIPYTLQNKGTEIAIIHVWQSSRSIVELSCDLPTLVWFGARKNPSQLLNMRGDGPCLATLFDKLGSSALNLRCARSRHASS